MNRVKRRHSDKFTTVDNSLVNNFNIPPMARFLYIFLSCQSNDFRFNNAILCKALDCKDATLRKYMKVLLDTGLVDRERQIVSGRNAHFDYYLNDPEDCNLNDLSKNAMSQKNDLSKNDRYNKEESTTKVVHVHSTVQEDKMSKLSEDFELVWNAYGKKRDKKKSWTAFKNLKKAERKALAAAIPAYVASTPDVQYRALLSTYIHGKRWEDEIEQSQTRPDIKLNESWEASYQRFTKAMNEVMGSRAGKVSSLTRAEYVEWSNHQRRRLTSRLTKNNWHKTMLAWLKTNVEGMSTYKLQKELKTADALLWCAFSEWMKQRGYWGEYKEPNSGRYPGPVQLETLAA